MLQSVHGSRQYAWGGGSGKDGSLHDKLAVTEFYREQNVTSHNFVPFRLISFILIYGWADQTRNGLGADL